MIINVVDNNTKSNNFISNVLKKQDSNFNELLDKIAGGDLANEICKKYNITLNVGSIGSCQQLLETNDIRCTNYVGISYQTLEKMEKDNALKKKVLSAIEEFCSDEQQAATKALQPPVKSSGMIVYPDGRCLYWVEGYPNEFGNEKEKQLVVTDYFVTNLFLKYNNQDYGMQEKDYSLIMQVMGDVYKTKTPYEKSIHV